MKIQVYEENKMSANDKTEKVLRELHILLSKSEPYKKEPTKVIVDKQKIGLICPVDSSE